MKVFTAHLRDGRAPVLIGEGFNFWAFLFSFFWLLFNRAPISAALVFLAQVLVAVFVADPAAIILDWGIAVLIGFSGRDLVRWEYGLRGFRLTHVLVAPGVDAALARLLALRPELAGTFLPPGRR